MTFLGFTTSCKQKFNALSQHPFVVGTFGLGELVCGGLCVIRSKLWRGSKHLIYAIRCCGDGTNCEGMVGVDMLIVVAREKFGAEMRKTLTAVYRQSDSWS